MTSEEPAATDPGALRAELGLPPVGVKLNREQSLRLLAGESVLRRTQKIKLTLEPHMAGRPACVPTSPAMR